VIIIETELLYLVTTIDSFHCITCGMNHEEICPVEASRQGLLNMLAVKTRAVEICYISFSCKTKGTRLLEHVYLLESLKTCGSGLHMGCTVHTT